MKVKKLIVENYKRFDRKEINLVDEYTGLIKNLVVLVGNNGVGKSSILQALACSVGTAVGKFKKPSQLDWAGFNYQLINSSNQSPRITTEIVFTDEEINATIEYAQRLGFRNVGNKEQATLTLNYLEDKIAANSLLSYNQFKGRFYATQIRRNDFDSWDLFKQVGSIMWYTEHRNSNTLSAELSENNQIFDDSKLRRHLTNFYNFNFQRKNTNFQLRKGQRDVFEELNTFYTKIFPSRKLVGFNPSRQISIDEEPYFFLSDGNKLYEISEMSAGERAIFPIILDFAWWNICNSIILIDELELHLHPPLQQAFLRALPYLGENNQFIITTHSDYVASLVSEDAIIRLD